MIEPMIERRPRHRDADVAHVGEVRLSVVFMDTTTLSFAGEGGEALGAHGYSKDHRPDLKQMVLAVALDGEGRPLCTDMLPGNTADVTVLLPIGNHSGPRRPRARIHPGGTGTQQRSDP